MSEMFPQMVYCLYEVLMNRQHKVVTFSITSSQIYFADFVIFTKKKQNAVYQFTIHTTRLVFGVFYHTLMDENSSQRFRKNNHYGLQVVYIKYTPRLSI